MKFIIQIEPYTSGNTQICMPMHDFSHALLSAIELANWRSADTHTVSFCRMDDLGNSYVETDSIPVGSIEFIERYVQKVLHKGSFYEIPILFPPELLEDSDRWFGRRVKVVPFDQNLFSKPLFPLFTQKDRVFAKDMSRIKGFTQIVNTEELYRIYQEGLECKEGSKEPLINSIKEQRIVK